MEYAIASLIGIVGWCIGVEIGNWIVRRQDARNRKGR